MPSLSPAPSPDPLSRGAWHRRASRPVLAWMLALVVLALVHRWVPQARWLLVHMATLGLLTTSVMIWAQHFADALLRTRADEAARRRQVRRIRVLTLSILVTCAGMLLAVPVVTTVGAAGVAGTMIWFAASLARQLRTALAARFSRVVMGYAVAASMLGIGAGFGAALAFSPPPRWQGRLLLAHQAANLLGFIGTTALLTLVTLGPTVMRVRMPASLERSVRRTVVGAPCATAVTIAGALLGWPLLAAVGVAAYTVLVVVVLVGLIRAARAARWGSLPLFPPLSMGAALMWLTGTLVVTVVLLVRAQVGPWGPWGAVGVGGELGEADLQALTVPFIGGFGLQLLLGAMSFLMPTVMGGGPRAVRAGLAELSRGGTGRVVLYNLALVVYLLADGSWTRVLASIAAAAVLVAFVPLMVRAVVMSLRVRRGEETRGDAPRREVTPTGTVAPTRAATGDAARGGEARTARRDAPADREGAGGVGRRSVGAGAALGLAGALGVLAGGQALDHRGTGEGRAAATGTPGTDAAAPSGRTVRASLSAHDMRFTPDRVTARRGDRVVLTVTNDDPTMPHDLLLATGETTGRIAPGASADLVVEVADGSVDGWCTIVGHRGMGMVFSLDVQGAEAGSGSSEAGRGGATETGSTVVSVDLAQPPSASFVTRDPVVPREPTGEITFTVREAVQEVAPGHSIRAMTYNGRVMGPVLRGELGRGLTVHLENAGTMGHSLDLHAGTVSPDAVMRTIAPGESLDYAITTDHAGMWLYHCSTMPMSVHLASGMFGAVIVPPAGRAPVDHEWVLVQSEGYLGTGGEEVDADKIATERPDVILWNGHANQYVHDPLRARRGERARIWVMSAGPSRSMSFHVVGGVFDTVFAEGAYLLRAEGATGGGSQALHLGPAQGGFVELTFSASGTYTAVSHAVVDMERGARALIVVEE